MENNKKHILVVDDDDRIRNLLKDYLNDNKFLTSSAKDGNEALEKISVFEFELIVLDVMMPGKSGFELTKEIIGDKVDISEIENISSKNIISELFHLILLGDLVSVYMAKNLNIDPYDISSIEKLKTLLKR